MSASPAVPAIDLPEWLGAVLALDHNADALQFEGVWRSWGWLARGVAELDALLRAESIGPSAKVGVLVRNRPEIVRTITALLATRRCLVTLSSAIPVAKLAAELAASGPPVVVAGEHDWDDPRFVEAVHASGALGIAVADGASACRVAVEPGVRVRGQVETAPGVAVEMLTSGTTGPPKRIDLRYRSLEYEIESTAQYTAAGLGQPRLSSGVSLIWNPLLHISGLRGLITALVAGRKMALLERFSVDSWAALVREHRPKAISLVPTAIAMVLDADLPRDTFDGVSALFAGTAPLDPELGRLFEQRYGVPVLVVYGATEFAGGVAGWTLADWRRFGPDKTGSVGRANAGVTVRVVDPDTGRELPYGAVGLLEVRAAQLDTADWVRTTDLARMDADGFIWIAGRADDVIVRGGFKVATDAVRDALASHPSVQEACVIGIADRRLGQVPVAAVELRPDAAPVTPDELLDHGRSQLAAYQVPVEVRIVDVLPRTPSMKISRAEVQQLFQPPSTS
jgi:acyl-CoA synthetase (AMP-forming)/AMP-acid ligase II